MVTTAQSWEPVAALTPLRVLVAAERQTTLEGQDAKPLVTSVMRAFQGGFTEAPNGAERYYAWGEDLGVGVPRAFWVPADSKDREQAAPRGVELRSLLRS